MRPSHFVIIGPMKRELVCRCSTFGNLDSQDCIEVETCTPSINNTQEASSKFNEKPQQITECQKWAKICSAPWSMSLLHLYAFICKKIYAKYARYVSTNSSWYAKDARICTPTSPRFIRVMMAWEQVHERSSVLATRSKKNKCLK